MNQKITQAIRLLSIGVFALLLPSSVAYAHQGNTSTGGTAFSIPTILLWALVGLPMIVITIVLWNWRAASATLLRTHAATAKGNGVALQSSTPLCSVLQGFNNYLATIKQFSRNARFFLAYALLSGLGTGVWNVMFNLYLLRAGFDIKFIGLFWLFDMTAHGLMAFPAGLIADKLGRRRTFFIATVISVVARGVLLFTIEPVALLLLAGLSGVGESFHGVTGGPFIIENSDPEERPHLFSINASFLSLSIFVGSISGGLLPLLWASVLGVPPLDPQAARMALVIALPLTIMALLPLAFIREKPVELVERMTDLLLLRNVVHFKAIGQLFLLSLLIGTAFGITTRFFNIFFADQLHASDDQVGFILAIGALGGAVTVLLTPILAKRWGMVRTLTISIVASVPFLVAMSAVPGLYMAATLFLIRGSIYGLSQPLRNQIAMELVVSKERGTTAGATHAAFDLGGGVGAIAAGSLITAGGFAAAFGVASLLFVVPGLLYYLYFGHLDSRVDEAPAPMPQLLTRHTG